MGDICFCGKSKSEERLICPRCFLLYSEETKRQPVTLMEWVKKKALAKLKELGISEEEPKTTLERELEARRQELRRLKATLPQEISLVLEERLAGAGQLRPDEVEQKRQDIRDELWVKKGGNRIYAQLKTLQKEVREKVAPVREVLREISKTEREHASVDQLLELVLRPKEKSK